MTNKTEARDELAVIIDRGEHYFDAGPGYELSAMEAAEAVLAAGYRKPHTITTTDALDALPHEAVLRDREGHVLERWGEPEENLWVTVMVSEYIPREDIALPATVLWEPEA